jgi:RNA polymerase sigma factor (sigma-70 family)
MSSSGEVTRLLAEMCKGNRTAADQVIPLVYGELHRLAAAYMRKERPNHTLQATALVHEAYLKLMPQRVRWQNRAHFLGVAAQQMRRVLVDHARKQKAARREGAEKKIQLEDSLVVAHGAPRVVAAPAEDRQIQLEESLVMAREQPGAFLQIHEALERFAHEHERQSRVVELRFFGGCTEDEIAQVLGVSVETVKRDWRFAKAWLTVQLRGTTLR